MSVRSTVAVLSGLITATMASAGVISFSFSPPPGGATMTNIANAGGVDTGLLVFNQNTPLSFTIDGTNEGFGVVNFPNARLALTMSLAPAQDLGGGLYRGAVQGTFAIYDYSGNVRTDIITGTVGGGTFLRFAPTNLIQFSSNTGLTYTAGPRLQAQLGAGKSLAPSQDGTFVLSNVVNAQGGSEIIGERGAFQTFFANTAFTGSSNVIPTPGAIALGMAGVVTLVRRRR